MKTHSIPSFDHLQSAEPHRQHGRHEGSLVEAQIRRNGQMKYQRTTSTTGNAELVMPDGEIMRTESR